MYKKSATWLLVLLLVGCAQTTELTVPTLAPTMALPVLAALTPTAVPTSTATPTVMPTAVPPAAVPSPNPSPATATPIPPPASPDLCRDAAALTAVQPTWIVRPGPWPRPAAAPGLIGQANGHELNLLHLGFDVEGDPSFVGDLLAALDRRQVQTTFFVLGSWADTYPEWVQEFARRGHELATHGYSHAAMNDLTAAQIAWELRSTEASIIDLTGQTTKPWLRPPFGLYSDASLQAAYAAGYTTVIWSGSANDWQPGMDADKMCATLRYYARPGAILYAHTNRAEIVTAVDRFIAEMQYAGYTFVPLSLLLTDDPSPWLQQTESGE